MLPKFFLNMDKNTLRAFLVVFVMFGIVALMIIFGRILFDLENGAHREWFASLSDSPWAWAVIFCVFVVGAFLGLPQWALIGGAILALGPIYGASISWVSTLFSAGVNFWLGRYFGADRLARYGGGLVNRMTDMIGRNGFIASLAVRVVPTGPFVLVNMAAGVSGMSFRSFIAGTAIGIIPKIAIVALLAQGILSADQSRAFMAAFFAIAVAFILILIIARRYLRRASGSSEPTEKITKNLD